MDYRGLPTLRAGPAPVASAVGEVPYLDQPPARGSETSLGDLARALWRNAPAIALAVLVVAVAAAAIVHSMRPYYVADGALVIGSRKATIPELQSALLTPSGDLSVVRSEVSVLTSRTVLQDVARRLDLARNPEFNSQMRVDDGMLSKLNPLPYVRQLPELLFGGRNGAPADEASRVAAEVEHTLRRNLDVATNGRDYVIWLTYRSESPETSAAVINALMASYLEQYVASNVEATLGANASLKSRADELKGELEKADAAAEQYARSAGVVETRLGTVSAQQLNDLNVQLSLARADRAAADERYRQAQAMQKSDGRGLESAVPEMLASPLIQKLREHEATLSQEYADVSRRLGPNHPTRKRALAQLRDAQGTIKGEVGKVVASLKAQADTARGRQAELEQKVGQLERAALSGSDKEARLERLRADAEGKRKIYNEFMLRVAQTARPDDQKAIDARVISQAVAPVGKAGPRTFLFVMAAGAITFLTAVATVLFRQQFDNGFENLDQVRATTGLAGLAAIPSLRGAQRVRIGRHVLDRPTSPLAETMRGFRTRLRTLALHEPPKVILVTSAEPGEGKSSFALNLARLSAHDGRRTLLIEYDLRRPRLRRMMGVEGGPDLAEALEGDFPWRNAVAVDLDSGMHFIVAPSIPGDRWSVLEAQKLEEILHEARAEYDYIILDSPPIMRVPDASLVVPHSDAVVLAVEWKKTRRRVVAESVRRLGIRGDQVCGIVLTKADGAAVSCDLYRGYGG